MLKQAEQDRIWRHYQNYAKDVFGLNYSRLRFLAKRCHPGTRVLNIGVGSGYLEKLLVDQGVEVCSLDPCGESVEQLRVELNMGQRAKQGYSQNIPFNTGYFDKVIMIEVLEHLSGDAFHVTLDEVRRVLKPGGEFTGTVPYRENLQDNKVLCPHCQAQFHRWGHYQSFDVASLRTFLKQHGFRAKRIYTHSFPDFRRPGLKFFLKAVFRYALGRLGEPLVGPSLYFVVIPTILLDRNI
jgi:SAM-dependent methyltransferase